MGSHPHQGGRQNTPLRGGERGQSKGQEHVFNCRWSSIPPCVRWSSNFMGLPLAGGVQFKLQLQVGPLSIRAGWTIVRRFVDEVPLRLRPKALSSYKVQLFNCITLLSDRASGPSCHSFALIRFAYSHRGPRSSAAAGKWSHLRSQFELRPPCEW